MGSLSICAVIVFVINVLEFLSVNPVISVVSGPDSRSGFPVLQRV